MYCLSVIIREVVNSIMSIEGEIVQIKDKIKNSVFQLRENDVKNCKAKHWRTFRIILNENGEKLNNFYCCSEPNCFEVIKTNLAKDGTGKLNRHYRNCNGTQRIGIESFFEREFRPTAAKKIKIDHKTAVDNAAVNFVITDMKPVDSINKPGLLSLLAIFTMIGAQYGKMNIDAVNEIMPNRCTVSYNLFSLRVKLEHISSRKT